MGVVTALLTAVLVLPASATAAHPAAAPVVAAASAGNNSTGRSVWTYGSEIPLGNPGASPDQAVFDPTTDRTFITEFPSTLEVVQGSPPQVVATIPTGRDSYPSAIALDPTTDWVYVGVYPFGIDVYSATTLALVQTVDLGFEPLSLAYDAATNDVYAAGGFNEFGPLYNQYNVSVVNATTDATSFLDWNETCGNQPTNLAVDPLNDWLIVEGPVGEDGTGVAAFNVTKATVAWCEEGPPMGDPYFLGVGVDSQSGAVFLPGPEGTWVVNGSSGALLAQFAALGPTELPTGPVAYDPVTNDVLLATNGPNVNVYNASTDAAIATVATPGTPWAFAADANGTSIQVLTDDTDTLSQLTSNDGQLFATESLGGGPEALAFDSTDNTLFVASSGNVSVLDPTTDRVIATVPVPTDPQALLYDPTTDDVFVADTSSAEVSVISGASDSVVATIGVAEFPNALAWDQQTDTVFVPGIEPSSANGVVTEVAAGNLSVVGSIPLGPILPLGLAFDPTDGTLLVSAEGNLNETFEAVSPTNGSVLAASTIPDHGLPGSVLYDPASGDAFVAGTGYYIDGDPDVYAFNASSGGWLATVPVGPSPDGLAVDPVTGALLVTEFENDSVAVIDPASLSVQGTVSLPVGTYPAGIAYDGALDEMFVADWGNDTVAQLTRTTEYPVSFSEVGLPAASAWSVAVGSTAASGNRSTLTVWLANGSYAYQVAPVFEYRASFGSGTVVVDGGGASVTVLFSPLYIVQFVESGLPAGVLWNVTFGGVLGSNVTTNRSGTIGFNAPNGTYAYQVGGVTGYTESTLPAGGNLTVAGVGLTENLVFAGDTYAVTFASVGLPNGTTWNVTLNGITLRTTGGSITFFAANGTYLAVVGTVPGWELGGSPARSNVTVAGSNVSVSLAWNRTTYRVMFTETGLGPGTNWSVDLAGTVWNASSPSTSLSLPNGTYAFSVPGLAGYNVTPDSGNVTVGGSPVGVSLTFAATPSGATSSAGGSILGLLPSRDAPVLLASVAALAVGVGVAVTLVARRRRS